MAQLFNHLSKADDDAGTAQLPSSQHHRGSAPVVVVAVVVAVGGLLHLQG